MREFQAARTSFSWRRQGDYWNGGGSSWIGLELGPNVHQNRFFTIMDNEEAWSKTCGDCWCRRQTSNHSTLLWDNTGWLPANSVDIRKYGRTSYMGQVQNGRLYLRYTVWEQLWENHSKVQLNCYKQKALPIYYCKKYSRSSVTPHKSWEKQIWKSQRCHSSFFIMHAL